ncbi:MAG: MtrB/PioB family decaheme-associated outer membrane protein [Gammaproteobacteria bacterium]|nr:MtrB/PioB family decaheme-associated outer membrane protein [Gammaproteobacteria bacterium]
MAGFRGLKLLLAVLFGMNAVAYAASDESVEPVKSAIATFNETSNPEVDISKWNCRFCPDPADEPWFAEIDVGAGYVSNDSNKFGEYNGLNEAGTFPILDLDATYRDENANYLDIRADDLGLSNRRIDMWGGTQGKYRVKILLDQSERFNLDGARTPYTGTTSQVLPGSWVAGSTTSAMTSLSTDLRDVDFSTRRHLIGLSGNFIRNARWNYDARFQRQTREGEIPFGATIGTTFADARAAILAKPIDYVTDSFELAANYRDNDVSGTVSYLVSVFDNNNSALGWENAFTTGANSGQVALEPDNEMQQISAIGQYRGFENLFLNGSISYARLTQNESFLTYTVNSILSPPPLPRNSLDARVDIARISTNANWTISDKTRAKLSYEYLEHVNDTDRATYTYVIADNAVTGIPRANFPYDFRTQKLKAEASYQLERDDRVSGGIEYGIFDRTYQEVDHATETLVWARYANRVSMKVNYSLKIESGSRSADSYEVLAEVSPPENPQLRKYNLADRDTLGASFDIDFNARDDLFIIVSLDRSSADYSNSVVGLTESDDLSIGIDAQYRVSDEISVTGYLQRASISSSQAGSTTASDPSWFAENEDSVNTLGFGISYNPMDEAFEYGVDYMRSDATGRFSFSDASITPFPDLKSTLDNITFYADFQHSENLTYRASYAYEVYQEKNWNLDGVIPGTIDNVLNLGETSPDYKIGVAWFTLKYRF